MIGKFKPGIYEHFKGGKYLALFVASNSETLDDYVVYISLYDNENSHVWIRPLKNFNGYKVFEDGTRVKRFKFIRDR